MTAGAKSKFTKEEKQEIWQYILETSIPGTVKLHRDFALERKLFNHSRFALNLWNACYRQNRWEEFHITDKERRPADLAHTGINNNIILPDQLVEMVHKKSIADYNAACIKLLKETHYSNLPIHHHTCIMFFTVCYCGKADFMPYVHSALILPFWSCNWLIFYH